jgi:hypothetical protein
MPDTFHAGGGIYHENIRAFSNGLRGTFGFARAASNTGFVNGQCHNRLPQDLMKLRNR